MPTSSKRWAGCLWPGGVHLWQRGSWPALALALAFAVLLNLLLAASMVWKEWLPPDVLAAGWLAAATVWIGSAWASWRLLATEVPATGVPATGINGDSDPSARERLFREAQTQYLQGNWFEAESTLSKLLKQDRRDIEARLMLATLWRHTHRSDDSLKEVEMLSRMENASKWEQELQHLRTRLTQRDAEAVDAA